MPYKYFSSPYEPFVPGTEFSLEKYFDRIYLLNLQKRPERLRISRKKFEYVDIRNYEVFNGTDGSVMNHIWEILSIENRHFKNPNYLGCAISHLSIYKSALENGYKRILIVEDDCRINRDIQHLFSQNIKFIPSDWNELLYLGFIPLSDDCSMWDYNAFSEKFISKNTFTAKNLWGLYSYGIGEKLMRELLEVYDKNFPMELDRYFVNFVQPRNRSYAMVPQLFCAEDGKSDNSGIVETSMIERSVDARFARHTDFI